MSDTELEMLSLNDSRVGGVIDYDLYIKQGLPDGPIDGAPYVHGGLNDGPHIVQGLTDGPVKVRAPEPKKVPADPKRVCAPKMKLALLCVIGTIVVSGCVAGVISLTKEPTILEITAVPEPTIAQGHSGLHKWTCG